MAEEATPEQAAHITAITVKGFKSLYDETRIELRPLTILAGRNSSGKSSVMQPLLLLKQTLEQPVDPGPLWLRGPNVSFTTLEQLLSRVAGPVPSKAFLVRTETPTWRLSYTFEYTDTGVHPHQRLEALPGSSLSIPNLEKEPADLTVRRWRFLALSVIGDTTGIRPGFGFNELMQTAAWIRRLVHVPGLRGNPERAYPRTATGPMFPGLFADYVASVIAHWQATRDDRVRKVGDELQRLGLTWKVQAKAVSDAEIELRVGRLPKPQRGGARDLVNIADVGFGVSQVLPVVVALLVANPGQPVYLEQPELHLHPSAQLALAGLLANAAKRGVQVIAETHSDLLLLGVQTLVAKGDLRPDDVILHWFQRHDDGRTTVVSTTLDEKGRYQDAQWPEDFGDVELRAESAYIDAGFPGR
jgi:predicted ATPase